MAGGRPPQATPINSDTTGYDIPPTTSSLYITSGPPSLERSAFPYVNPGVPYAPRHPTSTALGDHPPPFALALNHPDYQTLANHFDLIQSAVEQTGTILDHMQRSANTGEIYFTPEALGDLRGHTSNISGNAQMIASKFIFAYPNEITGGVSVDEDAAMRVAESEAYLELLHKQMSDFWPRLSTLDSKVGIHNPFEVILFEEVSVITRAMNKTATTLDAYLQRIAADPPTPRSVRESGMTVDLARNIVRLRRVHVARQSQNRPGGWQNSHDTSTPPAYSPGMGVDSSRSTAWDVHTRQPMYPGIGPADSSPNLTIHEISHWRGS